MNNGQGRLGRSLALPKRLAVIAFAVVAVPFAAFAHGLDIFATVADNEISGTIRYSSGPAPGLTVRLVDSAGKMEAETVSDADGKFRFTGPRNGPFTIVSETEDGHRAEFAVDAPRTAEASNPRTTPIVEADPSNAATDAAIRVIVREELQPLREQLAEQAGRSRARDIFGGIGYIAGVFGLIVLLKRQSGKAS